MKKKITLALAIIITVVLVSGCHKSCHCSGYDGLEYYYTPEQVDEIADGNCTTMIYQGDSRYHSVCTWE